MKPNKNEPRHAEVLNSRALDAWWYCNERSIEVVIETVGNDGSIIAGVCRIRRSEIEKWLERTKK